MTSSPVVFLGPSCDRAVAAAVLAADYRPPARRGDLLQAAADGATEIVLIDGYLVHAYPPSPREVAAVAERGVTVWGAASLGALRAVELPAHVHGVGWVYDQFRDRHIESDDEVVVSCDVRTGRATTVPMVNLRFAVKCAFKLGHLVASQAEAVLEAIGAIYLEDRTRARCAEVLKRCAVAPGLAAQMLGPGYDIKARDAIACLIRAGAT